MSELSLGALKYAFIDFDDTACVHTDHGQTNEKWLYAMIMGQDDYFDKEAKAAKLPGMDVLLNILENNGCKIYGLTAAPYSCVADTKIKWLSRNYPNKFEKVISVATWKHKPIFIKQFIKAVCCRPDEILIVDDFYKTTDRAYELGCQIMSASEITVRFARAQ